jgi:hypothetical protein
MARPFRPIMLIAVAVSLAAPPAVAQFGTIFREQPPPRPPGDIPGTQTGPPNFPPPLPRQALPAPEYPPTIRRPGPLPAPTNLPHPGSQRGPVQSQPLAPPPGGTAAPAQPRPAEPGQQAATPSAAHAPLPPEEVVVAPPPQRIVNPTAVFAGLDKITGRITSFDVAIDETVQFGALRVTPRACYSRPPTEAARTDAFLDVDEVTLQGEVRRIFTGWMFATSPGLNAVEHPIYDIWLSECRGGTLTVAETDAGTASAPQRPRAPQQPRQRARSVDPPR